MNSYQYVCVCTFLFGFEGRMWDLIISIPGIAFLLTLHS